MKNKVLSMPLIFTKQYWVLSMRPSNKILLMSTMAILIALNIAISSFFIPVGDSTLRVYFSFIPTSLACLIGGPIMALCYGFIVDILGFIFHPTGAFFPGYVLSSMLGALIYSLFFYRQKITITRILLCKLLINILVNICLNSLWNSIIVGKAFYYYFAKSIVKNIVLLPLEVLMLVVVFKAALPILKKSKLVNNFDGTIPFI